MALFTKGQTTEEEEPEPAPPQVWQSGEFLRRRDNTPADVKQFRDEVVALVGAVTGGKLKDVVVRTTNEDDGTFCALDPDALAYRESIDRACRAKSELWETCEQYVSLPVKGARIHVEEQQRTLVIVKRTAARYVRPPKLTLLMLGGAALGAVVCLTVFLLLWRWAA
jgi:hypothetical protein